MKYLLSIPIRLNNKISGTWVPKAIKEYRPIYDI